MSNVDTQYVVIEEGTAETVLPKPRDVEVRDAGACGFFGKHEVEMAAGRLVKLFQTKNSWTPFTILELVEFYRANGWDPNLMFFGLVGVWYDDDMAKVTSSSPWTTSWTYLVLRDDGRYCVTSHFLGACLGRGRPPVV